MPTIEGVIEAHGAGAAGNGKHWSLVFTLRPWREQGAAWKKDRLYVSVPAASMNAASRAAGRYPGGTIVRLAIGKITPASKYALPRATARGKVAKIAGDASAKAVVERRQQPRALTDPVLGKLTLERELSWFSGKRATRGKRYEFSIEVDDPDRERTVERELARGRAALLRTERALPAIRDAVARKTLPLYNDNWRERRPKLSRTAFLGKIRLASIQVAPKRITVYFDPKQLFFGHVIEVRIRPNGKVSEVCLAG